MRRLAAATILLVISMVSLPTTPQTQIVAQWSSAPGLEALFLVEDALIDAEGDLFVVDGHDIGLGKFNVFIYADDASVEGAVRRIVRMAESGQLPAGMKLGVAQYIDAARTDWTFRPVYPAGLPSFDIM